MRLVPLEAFKDRIPFAVAVNAVERGFRALALGEAVLPDPMVVELPAERAEVHVKGAHLKGAQHIVLKVATGFYQNRARGLPSGDGLFLLLDAATGVPALLLEEHGYLTDFRTAAAVALTLKYLAPQDTRAVLLVGARGAGPPGDRDRDRQHDAADPGVLGRGRHAPHVGRDRQPGEGRARARPARACRQTRRGPPVADGALRQPAPRAHGRPGDA
jgi:hypothetical protein